MESLATLHELALVRTLLPQEHKGEIVRFCGQKAGGKNEYRDYQTV